MAEDKKRALIAVVSELFHLFSFHSFFVLPLLLVVHFTTTRWQLSNGKAAILVDNKENVPGETWADQIALTNGNHITIKPPELIYLVSAPFLLKFSWSINW